MKNNRKNIITASVIFLLAVCAVLLYVRSGHSHAAEEAVLSLLFLVLLLSVWVMVSALRSSLRKTLYSYTNIGLIAGILFLCVLVSALLPLFSKAWHGELGLRSIYDCVVSFPRLFSHYALFFLIAVSVLLAISNLALIKHEGLCLHNALSLLFALLYIGGTLAVYRLIDLVRGYSSPLGAVFGSAGSLFLLLMLCYFECIWVGTAVMGWLAAREKPDYDKDFIIILGCSIDRRGGLLPLLKGRVNRAVRFAWQQEIATGKPVRYVPSGGQGANEIMSEGSAMELYLLTHGAEDGEVFPEKKSVSTYENMLFSKAVIDAVQPNAKIAFATTNYHMLRSGILARKVGLDAQGVAGDTKWYFWPNGFIREFFAILTMNVRAHVAVAAVSAAVCALAGLFEYTVIF